MFERLIQQLRDWKYDLLYRFHPKHRYNMIDTGLPPGYYDPDYVFLFAAMACLKRYIEECETSDCFDAGEEAKAIWYWWTVERPADEAERDRLCTKLYGDRKIEWVPISENLSELKFREFTEEEVAEEEKFRALEEKIWDDETKYLQKLVDIRGSMWI